MKRKMTKEGKCMQHENENPIEIEQPSVQKIPAIKEFPKQKETKRNTSFVWLYLKINISDFRHIHIRLKGCLITSHLPV